MIYATNRVIIVFFSAIAFGMRLNEQNPTPSVSATCPPSTIPRTLLSPDGRLRVSLETQNPGVERLTIEERASKKVVFNGVYGLTSLVWTPDNELLVAASPLYDRPRIVLIGGRPFRGRVLVRATHPTYTYPDGTNYFVVCSTAIYGGRPHLQYIEFPDVERIDFKKLSRGMIPKSMLLPGYNSKKRLQPDRQSAVDIRTVR